MAAVLFVLQAGLIWTFAERYRKPVESAATDFALRIAVRPVNQSQLATALFAEDPTLFQAPSSQAFSGRGWLATSFPKFETADAKSSSVWLTLGVGAWKPDPLAIPAPQAPSLTLSSPPATEFEPASIFLEPDPPPPASSMRMEGPLASRRFMSSPPQLGPQPGGQLLSNTVVQLGVDGAGQVVSARLLANSGSSAADATALATARVLRFLPAPPAWGKAIFSWQTVEPPAPAGK
jgi:TonB family protein